MSYGIDENLIKRIRERHFEFTSKPRDTIVYLSKNSSEYIRRKGDEEIDFFLKKFPEMEQESHAFISQLKAFIIIIIIDGYALALAQFREYNSELLLEKYTDKEILFSSYQKGARSLLVKTTNDLANKLGYDWEVVIIFLDIAKENKAKMIEEFPGFVNNSKMTEQVSFLGERLLWQFVAGYSMRRLDYLFFDEVSNSKKIADELAVKFE